LDFERDNWSRSAGSFDLMTSANSDFFCDIIEALFTSISANVWKRKRKVRSNEFTFGTLHISAIISTLIHLTGSSFAHQTIFIIGISKLPVSFKIAIALFIAV
jgi:hypothetical protein